MPRPIDRSATYLPGLDGVRAIAVGVVVAYHLGVPGMSGGLLGVGVFFTLSGFLITSILLGTWDRTRELRLGTFYLRRARRLLPAVVLVLLTVLAATALVDREDVSQRLWESFTALFYVGNWATIAAGKSYFQRLREPGPLDHLWSLAVEEQFYLLWPLLLLALVVAYKGNLRTVAQATLVLAAASFVLLWLLANPGFDNTRAYEGTDTRAGGLLLGAAVALVWRPGRMPLRLTLAGRTVMDVLGLAGLALILWLVVATNEHSMFLYRGGILVLSLATALLVAVVAHPASLLGSLLGVGPLRWVGERSYGIYLWHMPVAAFTPEKFLAEWTGVRAAVQLALTLALAALSWNLVEDPIRRHGLTGALRRGRLMPDGTRRAVPALVAGTIALALVGTTALSAAALVGSGPKRTAVAAAVNPEPAVPAPGQPKPRGTPGTPAAAPGPAAYRTSCTQLVHVGDSTSVGLLDRVIQPNPNTRINAQYKRIGITGFTSDIRGARSIVETYQGQTNARTAVVSRLDQGYDGCWVIAMGTNEVANQYVGGTTPVDKRIDLLLEPIGDRPVLLLTVKTLRTTGPYADREMQKMNAALRAACARYPNLRVYDWAAEAAPSWFAEDQVHFTTQGYTERSRRIADAFARAFSARGEPAPGCVIRSS